MSGLLLDAGAVELSRLGQLGQEQVLPQQAPHPRQRPPDAGETVPEHDFQHGTENYLPFVGGNTISRYTIIRYTIIRCTIVEHRYCRIRPRRRNNDFRTPLGSVSVSHDEP